jgi:hypothetical protein
VFWHVFKITSYNLKYNITNSGSQFNDPRSRWAFREFKLGRYHIFLRITGPQLETIIISFAAINSKIQFECIATVQIANLLLTTMHCAANWKVAGSIYDDVTGIFHLHNLSGYTTFLGLTQPLTEMSTRNNSWGNGGRCPLLTNLPPSCADCLEIWEPQPPRKLWASPGL